MEKIRLNQLGEIIFGSSDKNISKAISKIVKSKQIRLIAPKIYTSNLTETPEVIIRRNLFIILGHLYPNAVLSHRSALEFKPTEDGYIFLTYKYTKKIPLANLTIQLLEGAAPLENDNLFFGQLFVSQQARAFLENLQVSKKQDAKSKSLPLARIEEKLEEIIRIHGEEGLNKVRDQAKEIAPILHLEKEFDLLNKLISALLSTSDSNILQSPIATARALGLPYDAARLELFEQLFRNLQTKEFPNYLDKNTSNAAFLNFAFFESYFSNYIEGTIFEIEEAQQIITTQQPLFARHEDSHDILGTYFLVSNKQEMSKTPQTADELLNILQYRHQRLLSARADKKPGLFKDKNNRAGQTSFVDFNLVKGTLIKSFSFYQALNQAFAKAAFIMFVISEVHPFLDGNGRIARVMMNAELTAAGLSKIIIPTVFREDYMLTLRKLTRQQDAEPYIKMLLRAFEFSATIYNENQADMQGHLTRCNAFLEHTEGKLKIISPP